MGYTMGRFPADFKGTFRNERNEFVLIFSPPGERILPCGFINLFSFFTSLVLLPLPADA